MNEEKKKCNKISIYLIKPNMETKDLIKEELLEKLKILIQNDNSITILY